MPGHQLLCAEERESMSIRNVPINVKSEEMGKGKGGSVHKVGHGNSNKNFCSDFPPRKC